MNEPSLWIVAVDDRRTRLLRGFGLRGGRVRLEQVDTLENPWRALTRASSGGKLQQRNIEFRQRWAGEIGRWLGEQAHEHGFASFELLAPPRLSVALRREIPADLAEGVSEHSLDVGGLKPERLETHPEVSKLFLSQAG
jgi:hypothetical protein